MNDHARLGCRRRLEPRSSAVSLHTRTAAAQRMTLKSPVMPHFCCHGWSQPSQKAGEPAKPQCWRIAVSVTPVSALSKIPSFRPTPTPRRRRCRERVGVGQNPSTVDVVDCCSPAAALALPLAPSQLAAPAVTALAPARRHQPKPLQEDSRGGALRPHSLPPPHCSRLPSRPRRCQPRPICPTRISTRISVSSSRAGAL